MGPLEGGACLGWQCTHVKPGYAGWACNWTCCISNSRRLRCILREYSSALSRVRRAAFSHFCCSTCFLSPQLKDCKKHYKRSSGKGLDTEIFITEGQSAAGSLVGCRDAMRQAIFTLKGKPRNVCNLGRESLYKNVELYNLMCALRIEENTDNVRYNKVVLATDADVDGLHIRNLMITMFLRFFEGLVENGHLYILETPLFKVRNKKKTLYCYSEGERDVAVKEIGRGHEITRFKGLGEISPGEFKAFIGDEMRLTPVSLEGEESVHEVINFYMGANTQERRAYIMDNLILDEESTV